MVSFFSGEDSPSTDTSHFISLLPEVCRSVLFGPPCISSSVSGPTSGFFVVYSYHYRIFYTLALCVNSLSMSLKRKTQKTWYVHWSWKLSQWLIWLSLFNASPPICLFIVHLTVIIFAYEHQAKENINKNQIQKCYNAMCYFMSHQWYTVKVEIFAAH